MAYATAEHFSKEHGGFTAIKRFQELLNVKIECASHGKKRKRKLTLVEIAEKLNLSPAQVCRLRNKMFEVQYVTRKGTQQYVESQIRFYEREIKQREKFINDQVKLQFIPGKVDEQNRA